MSPRSWADLKRVQARDETKKRSHSGEKSGDGMCGRGGEGGGQV